MRSYKSIYNKKEREIVDDSISKSKKISGLIPQLKIHSLEQIRCLKAGSALGSLLITFSMMECLLLSFHAANISRLDDFDINPKNLGLTEKEKNHSKKFLKI